MNAVAAVARSAAPEVAPIALARHGDVRFAGLDAGPADEGSLAQALGRSAALPPGVTPALDPGAERLILRAERLAPKDADEAAVAEEIAGALAEALVAFRADSAEQLSPAPVSEALEARLAEEGWIVKRRGDALAVALPSRGNAILTASASGALRIRTELVNEEGLGAVAQAALARLLLEAAFTLHLVRPYAMRTAEASVHGLEARLGSAARDDEIDAALEALSVGVWALAAEAQALADEATATLYLSLRAARREP